MFERFDLPPDEFPEVFIDDTEGLFKIEKTVEDGKTVYRWVEKVKADEGKFLKQNVEWIMKNVRRLLQSKLNLDLNEKPSDDPEEWSDLVIGSVEELDYCSIVLKSSDGDPEKTLVGVTVERGVLAADMEEDEYDDLTLHLPDEREYLLGGC